MNSELITMWYVKNVEVKYVNRSLTFKSQQCTCRVLKFPRIFSFVYIRESLIPSLCFLVFCEKLQNSKLNVPKRFVLKNSILINFTN